MWPSLKPSQRLAVVAEIDPVSSAAVKHSGWVDASLFENLLAIVQVGVMTATGTVDAKLEQATTSGGVGAKDVPNKAITQLTQAGGNGAQQVLINFKQDDLDVTNGFAWVRLTITPATAASLIAGTVLGVDARYGPADGSAAASQIQIVG